MAHRKVHECYERFKATPARRVRERATKGEHTVQTAERQAASHQLLRQRRIEVQRQRHVCERRQRQHDHLPWVLAGLLHDELCC